MQVALGAIAAAGDRKMVGRAEMARATLGLPHPAAAEIRAALLRWTHYCSALAVALAAMAMAVPLGQCCALVAGWCWAFGS